MSTAAHPIGAEVISAELRLQKLLTVNVKIILPVPSFLPKKYNTYGGYFKALAIVNGFL